MVDSNVLGEMYAFYQDSNPERFNRNFIMNHRKEDNILSYLEDVSKALEVIEGIEFLGCEVVNDESDISKEFNFRFKIEESRHQLIKLRFRLTKGDETEDVELKLLFPALVDNFYYLIDGSKYFSIWQLVDKATYVTSKTFSLKTLLMPIVFRTDKSITITSDGGDELNGRLMILDIFKNRRNVLHYYLCKFGLTKTIEYFGMGDCVDVLLPDDGDVDTDEYTVFKAGKGVKILCTGDIPDTSFSASFIVSLYEIISTNKGLTREQVESQDFWLRKLGKYFTKNTNSQFDKAQRVMVSLERVLDNCTKKNLIDIPPEGKSDVFAIMRYMQQNYDTLCKVDSMDLLNKRMRMNEYLIHPILMRFSENTYRLLNNKAVTLRNMKSIFKNIKPGFVIKKLQGNKLLRYSNLVNDLDLFGCALRWSSRGPQSLADGTKSDISPKYRGVHPSYIGKIGLASASAGDPGLTGTFTPFVEFEHKGFFKC
jgi:hypothetical protein